MKTTLLASARSLEDITKLINKFYLSSSCRVEGEFVYSSRGHIPGVRVVVKRGRYRFEEIATFEKWPTPQPQQ